MKMASIEAILVGLPSFRPHHLAFASRHVQNDVMLRATVRNATPVAWKPAADGSDRAIAEVEEMLGDRRHPIPKPGISAKAPYAGDLEAVADCATIRGDVDQAWDEQTASRWASRLGLQLLNQ